MEAPLRISFTYSNGLNWYTVYFSNAESYQNARNLAKMLKGSGKESSEDSSLSPLIQPASRRMHPTSG